jgi:hypothetical protein
LLHRSRAIRDKKYLDSTCSHANLEYFLSARAWLVHSNHALMN